MEGDIVMRFWARSLTTRLLLYFLLLALVPLSIVGYVAYNRSQDALKERLFKHLTTTAILKEDEIRRWVVDETKSTRLLAQTPVIRRYVGPLLTAPETSADFLTAYKAIGDYLAVALTEEPDLLEIFFLTDVGGKVVLSTNKEHEGEYNVTSTYFTEGRKGTYVQNVYFSVPLGKTTMTIATPVEDENGQRVGVLGVHLNLDRMDELMIEKGALGTTGETYLVDKYNVFVSQARFGSEAFPRGVHTEGIDAALAGNNGTGLYENYQGVPVVGAYRWMDDLELALLAETEQKQAFAPVRQLGRVISLVSLGLVIGSTIIAHTMARQISGPVVVITKAAAEIAGGDLTQRAPVLTKDEIGILAQAFNDMASQLQELITGLEQRVADRTRGLQAAAEVSYATTSVLDRDELLRQVVELVRERFHLYYVGLFLLDEERQFAVLHAGTGEAGREMLAQGHKLPVGGTSMIGWCVAKGQARIALDVGEEAVRFDNPVLPETRSEMALPLRSRGRVIGAMTVQSAEEAAFDEADIAVMQTMADQVAVAIDNARLFAETQAALEKVEAAYQHYLGQAWTEYTCRRMVSGYKQMGERIEPLGDEVLPEVQRAMAAQRPLVWGGDDGAEEEAPSSALVVPIMLRGQPLGALGFEEPAGKRQWSEEDIALVEEIAEQLALAADNLRLLDETEHRATRERLIAELTTHMRQTLDVDTVLQTAVRDIGETLGLSELVVRIGTAQELVPQSSADTALRAVHPDGAPPVTGDSDGGGE